MFRKKILIILVVVLFAGNGLYAFPNKIFTSSGYILPGEDWNTVSIYNDDTVVTMLGGFADFISTFDKSTLNAIYGEAGVGAFDYSIINIYGGTHWEAHASGHGIINFSGDATAMGLGAGSDFGTVNMFGGTTTYVGAGDSGIINLYGGIITESLGAGDFSIVNIYGYGFKYNPTAGRFDGGQLTGFWFDDTPFRIDLYGNKTYSHINLIPEPSTLLLLGLAGLILRWKKGEICGNWGCFMV